jgi:RNA polymerase sigma-70 factor (ECF subfamily)
MREAPTGVLTPDETDETLVQRSREGDPSAREELFGRYFGVSYRVAHRLLGHEQDALDAIQEAFLKALVHLDDFQSRSEFRTWLLRIVYNAALDAGRRRGRRVVRSLNDHAAGGNEPSRSEDPALGLERADLRRLLDGALDSLSPGVREAFVLFAEADLSYKEIAAVQQKALGTVMSRIFAARKKLQAVLEKSDELRGCD